MTTWWRNFRLDSFMIIVTLIIRKWVMEYRTHRKVVRYQSFKSPQFSSLTFSPGVKEWTIKKIVLKPCVCKQVCLKSSNSSPGVSLLTRLQTCFLKLFKVTCCHQCNLTQSTNACNFEYFAIKIKFKGLRHSKGDCGLRKKCQRFQFHKNLRLLLNNKVSINKIKQNWSP